MQLKSRVFAALATTLTGVTIAAAALTASSAQADDGNNRIIGGEQTDNPWMVQLVFKKGTGTYGCSGEAISSEWVLTARHCVRDVTSMNAYYSNDVKNRGPAIVVDRMLASPKGDVALVHLSQAKPLSTYGRITAGYYPRIGDRGVIQGYGLMANKQSPTHLNQADVKVIGTSLDAFFGNAVHIQGLNGASNHGDSGGPLLVGGRIVAVCSTGDTADPGSNINATSNYANLTAHLPWIKEQSGVTPDGSGDSTTTSTTDPRPTDTVTPTETTPTETTPTETTPTETTPTETTPTGNLRDDYLTLSYGRTSGYFNVTTNDTVPYGARVIWSSLPSGPSLYVSGYSNGALYVYRGAYVRGTYRFQYQVEDRNGRRQTANVTLTLR